MTLLAKPQSLACLLVLALLVFASISLSYPISETSRPGLLHARRPDPRMVPGTSNLVDDIFKSMGMDNLAKLNHWKDEQKFEEGDSTATANEPQDNNIVYSDSHGKKQTNESQLSNPADDPSAFVSDLFTFLASRFKEAMHSSDEHTLS